MSDRLRETAARIGQLSGWRQISGPLFRKYVALFLAVVCVALLSNGLFEIWFSYREHKTSLIRIQREQAAAAAAKIGQFIREIESQVGWTTQLPWSAGIRALFDISSRLLRKRSLMLGRSCATPPRSAAPPASAHADPKTACGSARPWA